MLVLGAVGLIACAGWVIWLSSQTRDDDPRQVAAVDDDVAEPVVGDKAAPVPDGFSSIGGVNRPATDVDLDGGES